MEIFKKGVKEWERGDWKIGKGLGGKALAPSNLQAEDEKRIKIVYRFSPPLPTPTPTKEKQVKDTRGGLPALFSGSCGQFAFHM